MPRLALCLLAIAALRAAPDCAACHPAQAVKHAGTRHALALRPVADSEFVRLLPNAPIAESRAGFQLSYTSNGRSLSVRSSRGSDSAEGRIDWVLGAGHQGITPLVTVAGRWLEHRISYYSLPGRFDLTLGHSPGPSSSAAAALGVPQPAATIRACLGCHAKLTDGPGVAIVTPGVTCDRCHPATGAHFANPVEFTASAQVELCAMCHRQDAPGAAADPLNIRFQPLRLVKSRCFQKGGLACLYCHSAHADAVRADAGYYREKCQGCHNSSHSGQAADCLGCHMPKSRPSPYLQFTDHYIRRR